MSKKGTKVCNGKIFKILNLKDTEYKIWEGNRQIDQMRIDELIKMYEEGSYEFIPGIISISNSGKIYDGFHRYSAAKEYCNKFNKNMTMNVNILESDDPKIIMNDFIKINKSVPVPEVYLTDLHKKEICEKI